jgi:hypothetical protein
MGQVGLAIKIIDGKLQLTMRTTKGTIQELSLLSMYLDIVKDQLKSQIIKMSEFKKEEE